MFTGVYTEEDLRNMSYVLCYHCGETLDPHFKTKLSLFNMSLKHAETCNLSFVKYPCPFCPYKGKYKYHLKTHIKIHLNIKPYVCRYCFRAFSHKASRNIHLTIHQNLKPYLCLICAQSFRTLTLMKRHTLCDHQNIRRYFCTYCNKTYKDKKTLDNHILKHMNLKPHKCHYVGCIKSFRQPSNLLSHIRIAHTGERPFICKFCQFAFKERHHLESHLNLHLGKTKKYNCEKCNHSASSKWNLHQHMLIHRNETPFNCTICVKSFHQKVHLKLHLKSVHKMPITFRKVL